MYRNLLYERELHDRVLLRVLKSNKRLHEHTPYHTLTVNTSM